MSRRDAPRRRGARPGIAVLAAGIVAVAIALAADVGNLLSAQEQDAVALRYELRGAQPVDDLTVVAIDDASLSHLGLQWPLPRTLHAKALDRLREAGVRLIVYDVQFTERSTPRQDLKLFDAVGRTPGTVLVTSETRGKRNHEILGGPANLREVGAVAAAANFVTEPGGTLQRFRDREIGLPTVGMIAARLAGGPPLSASDFPAGGAWIDFRGPPGTIPSMPFDVLLNPRTDLSALRDRIVVVGATAPTLHDLHETPASRSDLMSGPEIQANAIWTALHGLPLRSAPSWLGWLAIVLLGLVPAAATLRGRAVRAVLAAPLLALLWLVIVQASFEQGLILPVSYPLMALLLGTVTATTFAFVLEREEGRRATLYSERLEREVSARTEELRQTQLEIVSRLGRAVESRDADTGMHIDRMAAMSERLALAIGMPAPEAELLGHAAVLHDVGKLGIPDRVLRKPGRFDLEERAVMETHTTIGAGILDGSGSAMIQLAAVIARSHHERWDGSGYPDGLRGEEIPLAARICAVCDVFDALISARSYKPSWPLDAALAELAGQRGRQFDPALVDAFLTLVPELEPELLAPPRPTSAPSRCRLRRHRLEVRARQDPRERPRQVPVPVAQQLHRRRDEDEPHQRRVERDRDGGAQADLLDRRHADGDEDAEHGDHDERGRRDRPCARGESLRHGGARVAGRLVALADAREQEDLVVHRQPEHDREHQRRRERVDLVVDEAEHAERGADAEQVHQHRLEREHDRAQQHEQHDVGEPEQEQQDLPHRAADEVDHVGLRSGDAADVEPHPGAGGGRQRPRSRSTVALAAADSASLRGSAVSSTAPPPRDVTGAPTRAIPGSAASAAATRSAAAARRGRPPRSAPRRPGRSARPPRRTPARVSWSRGNWSSAPVPVVICSAGDASASSTAVVPATASTGRSSPHRSSAARSRACRPGAARGAAQPGADAEQARARVRAAAEQPDQGREQRDGGEHGDCRRRASRPGPSSGSPCCRPSTARPARRSR